MTISFYVVLPCFHHREFITFHAASFFFFEEGYCVFPQCYLALIEKVKCFKYFLQGCIFKISDHFSSLSSGLSKCFAYFLKCHIQTWTSVFQLRSWQSGKATLHTFHMTLLPVFLWVMFVFIAIMWHCWPPLFTLPFLIVTEPVVSHPTFMGSVFILVQHTFLYWTACILFFSIPLLHPQIKIT